jgi:hypothetical protein
MPKTARRRPSTRAELPGGSASATSRRFSTKPCSSACPPRSASARGTWAAEANTSLNSGTMHASDNARRSAALLRLHSVATKTSDSSATCSRASASAVRASVAHRSRRNGEGTSACARWASNLNTCRRRPRDSGVGSSVSAMSESTRCKSVRSWRKRRVRCGMASLVTGWYSRTSSQLPSRHKIPVSGLGPLWLPRAP